MTGNVYVKTVASSNKRMPAINAKIPIKIGETATQPSNETAQSIKVMASARVDSGIVIPLLISLWLHYSTPYTPPL